MEISFIDSNLSDDLYYDHSHLLSQPLSVASLGQNQASSVRLPKSERSSTDKTDGFAPSQSVDYALCVRLSPGISLISLPGRSAPSATCPNSRRRRTSIPYRNRSLRCHPRDGHSPLLWCLQRADALRRRWWAR